MTSSESLVATGRPYGSRQQLVSDMRQAGLPLAPSDSQGVAAPQPAGGGRVAPQPGTPPMGGLALLEANSPDAFPFLADPPPTAEAAGQTGSVMSALGASAQSSFAQAVVARLAGG